MLSKTFLHASLYLRLTIRLFFRLKKLATWHFLDLFKPTVVFQFVALLFLTSTSFASETISQLQLTDRERLWLEANPGVTFTGDPNWLPYEAFNKQGEYIGIVSEHLDLIAQITGIEFQMSPSETWTESTEKAKKGLVDILSETDDSDLKSHLNFTRPYIANPIVIAMRSRENYVEDINSIKDKNIAVIKDYGYVSKIRRKYPNINFTTVDDIHDGLIAVSTGEVDVLFCTLALCSYTIAELGLNNVKITGKTEFDTKLALGVQKDLPELLSILNKAIATISREQQQAILDGWIKDKFVQKTDYTLVYQIGVAAFVLLGIFAFWNRRLSQEINLRLSIEKDLKASSENNERYRVLFYESPVGHALNRLSDGYFLSVNQAFANITGYSLVELNQLSYWDLTPESFADDEAKQLESLNTLGRYGPYEKHYIRKDGSRVAVRLNGTLITDPDGEKLILSVVEDISERIAIELKREQAEEELRLASMVYKNSSEAMTVTDANNLIVAINPAFTQVTGYTLDEVIGKTPNIMSSGRHDQDFYKSMWEEINTTGKWQGEIWDKRKNGEIYAKSLIINTIRDEDGSVHRYVALFSDITERKLSEELIWKQANFDSLTGLPNRDMFRDRLEQETKKSDRTKHPLALLLIDLDQFKEVNDTLGHDVGDTLLKETARRISGCIRESDTVARLGGDEFAVILPELSENGHAEEIAEKIITKLVEPFKLGTEVIYVSASIGITLYPNDTNDIDALMKNADQAMYVAKNKGRNRFSYFTQALQDAAQTRLRLTNDLRGALAANQFKLYFQPIVDLVTGKTQKAEALLRWQHPERGMVSPIDFIPLTEETGLINEIGDWVFKEAAHWEKYWRTQFGTDFQVSVNMSPVQFKVESNIFAEEWFSHLQEQDLSGKNIVVEITEGLLLNAEPDIMEKLLRLHDAGIQVAIDDFGTGYSSLSYLKKFDIDYLKIDQSFTRNLETDENNMALSEAIIVMAHRLGLKVIAEGVETKGQQKLLSNSGCDYAQGYLYSKPIPPEEFEVLMRADDTFLGIAVN